MIREETIKNIQQHAVPPPPMVWGKIATQLDTIDSKDSSKKTAVVALDPTNSAPKKRFPFKAQIAAALLLLIGTAIIWFQIDQKKEATTIIAAAKSDTSVVGGVTIYPPATTPPIAANTPNKEQANKNQSATSAQQYGTKNNIRPAKVQFTAIQSTNFLRAPTTQSLEKLLADDTLEGDNALINENYFYITSKEGQQVRVSKKIASVILDDWGIDPINSLSSKLELGVLSNKIAQWKTKLASSAFIPSASNLMDLLYFIDLQED